LPSRSGGAAAHTLPALWVGLLWLAAPHLPFGPGNKDTDTSPPAPCLSRAHIRQTSQYPTQNPTTPPTHPIHKPKTQNAPACLTPATPPQKQHNPPPPPQHQLTPLFRPLAALPPVNPHRSLQATRIPGHVHFFYTSARRSRSRDGFYCGCRGSRADAAHGLQRGVHSGRRLSPPRWASTHGKAKGVISRHRAPTEVSYRHYLSTGAWGCLAPRDRGLHSKRRPPATTASAKRCICATPTRNGVSLLGLCPRSTGRANRTASAMSRDRWTLRDLVRQED